MNDDDQVKLRNELCSVLLPAIERKQVNLIEAAVAAMGAAAVVIACLPPDARAVLIEGIQAALPDHVAKRAAEIRDGRFDDMLARALN